MSVDTTVAPRATPPITVPRLHALRAGYLFMGVGLALVKWPLLGDAHALPVYEGVTLCLLTALSLLALLGVRHPVAMLPVLLLETAWKVLWLSLVALPAAVAGDLGAARTDVLVSCTFVVVVVAVTPWRHAWRTFVTGPGDRWR
jgi:hypothetical protein